MCCVLPKTGLQRMHRITTWNSTLENYCQIFWWLCVTYDIFKFWLGFMVFGLLLIMYYLNMENSPVLFLLYTFPKLRDAWGFITCHNLDHWNQRNLGFPSEPCTPTKILLKMRWGGWVFGPWDFSDSQEAKFPFLFFGFNFGLGPGLGLECISQLVCLRRPDGENICNHQ